MVEQAAHSHINSIALVGQDIGSLQQSCSHALALEGWQHKDLTQLEPLPVRIGIEGVQCAKADLRGKAAFSRMFLRLRCTRCSGQR